MTPTINSTKTGFTIIEVIVVIVIMGILLSVGIASFSSSQQRSKKESTVAIAEKVKLTLATHFSEKDRYPQSQTGTGSVVAYLTAKGESAVATEFTNTSKFVYAATTAAGGACSSTGANKCEKYTITVKKETWQGGASDADVVVTPS